MAKNVKYGLAYLFPIVAPLILLLACKDKNDEDDKLELGQALAVQIGVILGNIVINILKLIPFIGGILGIVSWVLSIVSFALAIYYFTNHTVKIPYAWDFGGKIVEKM